MRKERTRAFEETGTKDCGGIGAEGTVRSQIPLFCATSGRDRHSSTMGGILANISEAAIRVAIQAHLPEDRGREGRGRRKNRSMRGGGEGGRGGDACSQSVTEIERFHEQERDTEAESAKQRWGLNTETEVVGKICMKA